MSVTRGVIDARPQLSSDDMEEMSAYQNELERLVGYHLVQALHYAELRHGAGYALLYVEGTLDDIIAEYRRITATPRVIDPNRRRSIGARLRKRIYERDEYRCTECGTHLDLTIDHIIPVTKGGTNDDNNLRCLCQPCNSRKGARV